MDLKTLPKQTILVLSACLLLLGGALVIWLLTNMPSGTVASSQSLDGQQQLSDSNPQAAVAAASTMTGTAENNSGSTSPLSSTLTAGEAVAPVQVAVGLVTGVPPRLITATQALSSTTILTDYIPATNRADAAVALYFDFNQRNSATTYRYTFAAATRFDTTDTTFTWQAVEQLWQHNVDQAAGDQAAGEADDAPLAQATETDTDSDAAQASRFSRIAVLTETLPALISILGEHGSGVRGYGTMAELIDASWQETPTLALVPFDLLDPRLAVLAIDGQKPIENANKFDEATYPLVSTIYGHLIAQAPAQQAAAQALLAQLPPGNRDAAQLTVIAMTGVTAMVRLTAAEMDKRGNGWPAEIVGPELTAADITVISNEVPFVPGCETDTRMDNLTFCSKPAYMQALTDVGVDIIGLTGNHQNDYGRTNAVISLEIYEEAGLPVYGGGRHKEDAFAPLYLEHNGNQLAFLGANSYGPTFAWATDSQPGSAEFDLNIMSATIRNIKQLGRAKVVLAELQYQESYDVVPLLDQRQNFNALVRAGADIVTGIQSHVPQAMEFTEGKLILYGLGNFYFDQMWSQNTREGLIVKHTIYNNRHLSTQILPTLIYDYGQPRWTTPAESKAILDRVYGASYW
jgi:poly-gamma-glutamate synthesis protein (capsule biosynthesis protein)